MGLHLRVSNALVPACPGILHLTVSDTARAGVCARATALPCRMHTVDRISIDIGLAELERSEAVALLRECRRILAPGGRLVVSTGLGSRWVASPGELRELAGQVGLTPATRDGDAGPSMLELTKRLPALSTTRPLVSVLIPAFKHQFFAEAVESVLAQTYDNLELVICDDGLTAAIREIAERCQARDARVRYFRNDSTLGSRQNHIRCLDLASGELVKFLSDDDRLHPECLERMAGCMVAHPDVTLVTSHRQCIDAAGRPLADLDATARPVREDSRADGAALARAVLLLRRNMIGEPSTTMFRRQDLVGTTPDIFSLGGRRYETIGDVVMWLNLLGKGDAVYLADTLSDFRLHPDQEQRGELVRTTAAHSWTRMRVDANRLGLIPADAPIQLSWAPLATNRRAVLAELSAPGSRARAVEPARMPRELDGGLDHWPATDQQIGGLVDGLGWVVSDFAEPVKVRVMVDGCAWPAWVARLSGPGPQPLATSPPRSNPFPGFYLMLDTRTIPDGPHVLTFVAVCGARTLGLGERQVTVRNRELLGVADGPGGELLDHVVRERDAVRRELQARLDMLARERDAERLETEKRIEAITRGRDSERLELEARLDAGVRERHGLEQRLAATIREAHATRLELESRLDGLAWERDARRLDLERRLSATARERDTQRTELLGRIHAVAREHDALARDQEARIAQLVRDRDQAAAQLGRMLRAWPVRLYARVVRLPLAGGMVRWITGLGR